MKHLIAALAGFLLLTALAEAAPIAPVTRAGVAAVRASRAQPVRLRCTDRGGMRRYHVAYCSGH